MTSEEFDALVADIKANGLRESMVLYEGMILDGRHRYRACKLLGWEETKIRGNIRDFCLLDGEPAAYINSANIHRRHLHLTVKDKRDLIAKVLAAQPEKSDRQIAKQARVDHKTVGAIRRAKEATGEISPVDKRVGADGKARKQPAKKKPITKVKPAELVTTAAEFGISEKIIEAHGPKNAEAIRRFVQRQRKRSAKRKKGDEAFAEASLHLIRAVVAYVENAEKLGLVPVGMSEQFRALLGKPDGSEQFRAWLVQKGLAEEEGVEGLGEKLRAAEIKITGLEAEIEDLKDENAALKTENAALREKLEAAQQVAARGLGIDDGGGSS